MKKKNVSADFPYHLKPLEIEGSTMRYLDEGEGDPILFLHGNPTSSYLWRNIIPHLLPLGRCIAPDLIGMGESDKPDIDYRFSDHYRYIEKFIEKLGLKNITLIVHDWGSALGFHYAMQHEQNIKGIAFMEAILAPVESWKEFPSPARYMFKLFRTPVIGWFMIAHLNLFLKQVMSMTIIRKLTDEEKDRYRKPFPFTTDRLPVWRWPNEIPIEGKPEDVHEAVSRYSGWLRETETPKLLLYARPGALVRKERVEWCRNNLKNLAAIDIGKGIHYVQEDNPDRIGHEIADWLNNL